MATKKKTTTTNPAFPKGIASITFLPIGHNPDGFGNASIPVIGYIVKYKFTGDPVSMSRSIEFLIDGSGNLKLNSNLDPLSPGTNVPYSQSVLDWFQDVYYAGNA